MAGITQSYDVIDSHANLKARKMIRILNYEVKKEDYESNYNSVKKPQTKE